MNEEKKEYQPGSTYTLDELMVNQFKILFDELRKKETTAEEKIGLSNAMVRIYETIRYS